MKYQRHLPHWHNEGAVFHASWLLANSQPIPNPEILLRDYVRPAPEGPMWLADARIAQSVVDALHYGTAQRKLYELSAYVVMPNHVHILIEPQIELSAIMHWLKGRTARTANRILARTGPFLQDESYDHIIRSPEEFRTTAHYIEENPVRAGLVETTDQWRWSSAFDRPRKTRACRTAEAYAR